MNAHNQLNLGSPRLPSGTQVPARQDPQPSLCTQLSFLRPRSLPSRLGVPECDRAQAPAPTLPRAWDRLSAWALSCLRVKASPTAGLGDRGAPLVLSRLWLCGLGRPGGVWRVSWRWWGSTLELAGEQGWRDEGRAWPTPKAPPLSVEGARSWFPAPAWEPRPQRGRKLLPGVCRASGRWERQLLNFPPRGPEPGRGLPGWLPADLARFSNSRDLGSDALGQGPSGQMSMLTGPPHARPHRAQLTRGAWRQGVRYPGCRQLSEPGRWEQRGRGRALVCP